MKKKIFLIAALMLLTISICAVSAEDINQTDDSLEISASDVISADESAVWSFSNLSKDIDDSTDELDIKSDYKFNISTDERFANGIEVKFGGAQYTINGNNHVIDADNKSGVFKFNGKTYTAKTDKKGIAKITIKKSVLKKLKAGKKVNYQVTYLKNTVKQSVKVKK